MNATKISYTLDSTPVTVDKAEFAALTYALRSGFNESESELISVAIREAARNAVMHGNECDTQKHVTLSFEIAPKTFRVSVRDEGKGLNPDDIPDPLAPENLLKPSGRGIFLMRSFMDEVHIRNTNPGTEIIMVKHVRRATQDDQEASK